MVSISEKTPTKRKATARCAVRFSNPTAARLVRENQIKKGDVIGVARVAGIMAAKRTADVIPLCHPLGITGVEVDFEIFDFDFDSGPESGSVSVKKDNGDKNGDQNGSRIEIAATVSCDGKTGVEMEALTAAATAALTVYDMCKAMDKGIVVEGLRVVLKEGGKSGRWVEGMKGGGDY